jgi:hypothetical protein
MADAADVGRRVLEGLAAGRRRSAEQAKERAAPLRAAVLDEVNRAILGGKVSRAVLEGKKPRGLAIRVHRQLRGRFVVSERQVRRIIDALYSLSDSPG